MKFVVMHRCMKCRFYREFMREMEEEDQEIMDEIDREMAEAERRAEVSHKVDPVLGLIEEQELKKLRRILRVVIPDDGENNENV